MIRSLYIIVRLFADLKAISRGRIGQRLWNRAVGRAAHRMARRFYQ